MQKSKLIRVAVSLFLPMLGCAQIVGFESDRAAGVSSVDEDAGGLEESDASTREENADGSPKADVRGGNAPDAPLESDASTTDGNSPTLGSIPCDQTSSATKSCAKLSAAPHCCTVHGSAGPGITQCVDGPDTCITVIGAKVTKPILYAI